MMPDPDAHRTLPAASRSLVHDVAVVGMGAVGLLAAITLARDGFDTVLVGTPGSVRTGRTVALLEGSVRLLEDLGVWPGLAPRTAPLACMRIVDATGSLFRTPPVQFDAAELGRAAFGHNIENAHLEAALAAAAARMPALTMMPNRADHFAFAGDHATVQVGAHAVHARLMVAADGRHSLARKMAGIGVRTRTWPQTALTGTFVHEAPHGAISTEFHTRQGPFTLVPLPDAPDGARRSSLVWVMSPAEAERRLALSPDAFSKAVTDQAARLLGAMTLEGGIGAFPIATSMSARLTGPRLVLTGEAAHALPPIGAQGLNLSFRDVAALGALVADARMRGRDIGGPTVLAAYDAARRGDVALRSLAVDMLNGALLSRSPLVDALRGGGLAALQSLGPLRRGLMREGLIAAGNPALPPRKALPSA